MFRNWGVRVVHLDCSSMLARIQVSPYTSFTIRTCTGSASPDPRSSVSSGIDRPHPHPSTLLDFHIHHSEGHHVEDLATPNILQIYGTPINIYISFVWSYTHTSLSFVRHLSFLGHIRNHRA